MTNFLKTVTSLYANELLFIVTRWPKVGHITYLCLQVNQPLYYFCAKSAWGLRMIFNLYPYPFFPLKLRKIMWDEQAQANEPRVEQVRSPLYKL